MATILESIAQLYVGYYDRAPDPEGLQYWVGRVNAGVSLADIANSFATSPEAIATYPYFAFPNVANAGAFLESVYQNLFGRAIDADGLAYYSGKLASGATPVGQIIAEILGNAETNTGSPDQAYLANKVEVGLDWALTAANTPGFTYNTAAADYANSVLETVDGTQASVDAALLANDEYFVGAANPGVSQALTTALDVLNGGTGNDTFLGTIDNTPTQGTFNTGDSINGGAGQDTLKLIIGNGVNVIPGSLTSVETIQVQDLSGAAFDLTNATGVTKLVSANSTASTYFYNVNALAAVELTNINGGAGVRVDYAPEVVAGTSDVQAVSVKNAFTSIETYDIETLSVTATGEENSLGITGDFTTVNVAGAGNINFGSVNADVTTFNASAATGDVEAGFYYVEDITVTGGAGDDTFDLYEYLTEDDVIDGGAGIDTVRIDTDTVALGDFSTATAAAGLNALVGVERLSFYDVNGVTLNGATFTNTTVTEIEFNTDGDDVINNAGSRSYQIGQGNDGNLELNLNAATTTVNLVLLGSDPSETVPNDGAGVDMDDLTINLNGTQPPGTKVTVNIVSEGDLPDGLGRDYNDIDTVDAVAGSTFKITGSGNLDLGEFVNNAIIDASELTGSLHVEGSFFTPFTLPGTFFNGGDIITLGSGEDIVWLDQYSSGVADDTGVLKVDVINGFKAGADGDVLDIEILGTDSAYAALSAAGQNAINALSGASATLLNAANAAALAVTADDTWSAFSFQGQTYAFYSQVGATAGYDQATDSLVQLTGVSVASLTTDNFA